MNQTDHDQIHGMISVSQRETTTGHMPPRDAMEAHIFYKIFLREH